MPFTLIDSKVVEAAGSGTSLSLAATMNIAAGDLLVGIAGWLDGVGGTLAMTDGGSNVFTLTATEGSYAAPATKLRFGYMLSAFANGTATFSFTNTTSRPNRTFIVLQLRPNAGATVSLDPSPTNYNYVSGETGTTVQSSNMTTVGTDTVVVGAVKTYLARTFSSHQIGDVAADGVAANGTRNCAWYRILTAGMTGHSQVTLNTAGAYVVGIIGFKSTGGGAGGSIPGILSQYRRRTA